MATGLISLLAALGIAWLLDNAVRPRRRNGRRWPGLLLHGSATGMLFGLLLAGSGNATISSVATIAVMALLMIASNAKRAMLGEPLLFSDFALIVWIFRHPRFYLTALSSRQRWLIGISAPLLLLALAASYVPSWMPHLIGLAMLVVAAAALAILLGTSLLDGFARTPDIESDLRDFGLIATLLLYWVRWRAIPDTQACPGTASGRADAPGLATDESPELIVVVQCESFADPVALTGDADLALSGLAEARAGACQWGDLGVSGFGAYTMRTEYGVLFGRSEAMLGFRRFDPFLTALGDASYALPARLMGQGFRSLFVHPHDMRFYGRDRLMQAIGFEQLIGEESFPPIQAGGGRYTDDHTLGAALGDMIDAATARTLIYAVTMENHGPWIRERATGSHGGLDAYLHHLRNSDAMLSALMRRLSAARRPALLVFFGDHRPSIPGVVTPGGARDTPYVMLRFSSEGAIVPGDGRRIDLTPDALHHAILSSAMQEADQ